MHSTKKPQSITESSPGLFEVSPGSTEWATWNSCTSKLSDMAKQEGNVCLGGTVFHPVIFRHNYWKLELMIESNKLALGNKLPKVLSSIWTMNIHFVYICQAIQPQLSSVSFLSQLSQLKRNYFLNHQLLVLTFLKQVTKEFVLQKELQPKKKNFSYFEKTTWKLWCLSTNYYCLCLTDIGQWSFYFSKKATHWRTKLKSIYLCKGNDDDSSWEKNIRVQKAFLS